MLAGVVLYKYNRWPRLTANLLSEHRDTQAELHGNLLLLRLELKCSRRAPGYFTPLIGDKGPPAARYSDEVASALNGRLNPRPVNGGHSWCLSSSLSLSVGFSIQDFTRSAP